MRTSSFLALSLLLLLLGSSAFAAEDFQAGVAKIKITPTTPIRMAGYASRTSESLGVEQDIWARALALRDAQGHRVVIVTNDLVGFSGKVASEVFSRAKKQYGLNRQEILLCFSHTHSGPVIRDTLVGMMAGFTPAETKHVLDYSASLVDNLVSVIGAALKDLAPAKLETGHGSASFAINRRQPSAGGVRIGVNPTGPVDHDVPVLKVTAPDGRLRAIFFGYACHNTTNNGKVVDEFYRINGDYAGHAETVLEKQYPGATAMFTILCGGDQNPNPRGTLELVRKYGTDLATEVSRVIEKDMKPVQAPIRAVTETIKLDFAPHTRQTFIDELSKNQDPKKGDKWRALRAKSMLATYDQNKPIRSINYPIQAIRLGNDLTLLALGGEVVVDYDLRCKREYAGQNLVVIGYANDVMGYIPSQRVLHEGGYEAETNLIYYGYPGPFADNIEDRVFGGIHKILERVGIKPAAGSPRITKAGKTRPTLASAASK